MMWRIAPRKARSRNGWPMMNGCSETANTSGYFCDCSSISSNWSMTISANCRPVWRRKTSAGRVVEFDRVGHRQDRPGARPHPDRLVVEGPVHDIAVAGLLQQVEGDAGLARDTGPSQPSGRLPREPASIDLGAFGDQARLVLLPQHVLALGIGAAVADIFVAAPVEPLDDVGAVLQHRRVDVVRAGQAELVEQVEIVPDARPGCRNRARRNCAGSAATAPRSDRRRARRRRRNTRYCCRRTRRAACPPASHRPAAWVIGT